MHASREIQPALSISFPRVSQSIATTWTRVISSLRQRWAAARQDHAIARLAPHLRYDIGELDCRPPLPRPLAETFKAYQQSPERLRHL